MGNCWSCGAPVGGARYMFTCPACTGTAVMTDIRNGITDQDRAMQMIASGLSEVKEAVSAGLSAISDGLSLLAGIVQGGFDELNWELQQQTQILRSIDETLKTPSQTQAREWREMAEALRSRGCFDEAGQWFAKSLAMNPLDFRTYVGFGVNCLRKDDFDGAEGLLLKSLPHAPRGRISDPEQQWTDQRYGLQEINRWLMPSLDFFTRHPDYLRHDPPALLKSKTHPQGYQFDYKSFSHRLIGRICACRGDYEKANVELQSALVLSPDYPEGNYDYALYCVQSGRTSGWEEPLRRAIAAQPGYLDVATVERRFEPVRQDIDMLLSGLLNEVSRNASQAIEDAQGNFANVQRSLAGISDAYRYAPLVEELSALIDRAKGNFTSRDYQKIVKAHSDAVRAATWSSFVVKSLLEEGPRSTEPSQETKWWHFWK